MTLELHIQWERKIPEEIIRQVWLRDAGICQHPKCKKRGEELHHIKFRSEGVDHSANNLVLLCSEHHSFAHSSREWRSYWTNWKPLIYIKIWQQ